MQRNSYYPGNAKNRTRRTQSQGCQAKHVISWTLLHQFSPFARAAVVPVSDFVQYTRLLPFSEDRRAAWKCILMHCRGTGVFVPETRPWLNAGGHPSATFPGCLAACLFLGTVALEPAADPPVLQSAMLFSFHNQRASSPRISSPGPRSALDLPRNGAKIASYLNPSCPTRRFASSTCLD